MGELVNKGRVRLIIPSSSSAADKRKSHGLGMTPSPMKQYPSPRMKQ